MSEFKKLAAEKLRTENKDCKGLSNKASAIKSATYDAVLSFIEQDEEFAQAVYQKEESFKDCLEHCVKNCGNSISDLTVFERAASYYFPGAKINFKMEIQVNPYEESNSDVAASSKAIVLNLDDFLM